MTTQPVPTESQEGRTLVAYLRVKSYRFSHIPNETGSGRGARFQGIRNKQQGTSPGFPDYVVITKQGAAFIELKRKKGSKTSQQQIEWITALQDAGHPARICKGADEAINFIEELEVKHGKK